MRTYTILILILVSIVFTHCRSTQPSTPARVPGDWEEGWIDDDTFRFINYGTDRHGIQSRACDAAMLSAMARAVEKLAESGCSLVKGKVNFRNEGDSIVKEIHGRISGGRIVNTSFDRKTKTCRVAYEISESGLKKKVIAIVEKHRSK